MLLGKPLNAKFFCQNVERIKVRKIDKRKQTVKFKKLVTLLWLPIAVNAEFFNNPSEETAPPEPFQQNLLRENPKFNYSEQRLHTDKVLYRLIQNTEYDVKDKCIYFEYTSENDSKTFRNCFIIQDNQVQREDNSICDSNRKLRNECYTKSDDKIKAYVDLINAVQKRFVYEYDKELEELVKKDAQKKEIQQKEEIRLKEIRQKEEAIEKAKQAERIRQEELEKKERVSVCTNWKTKLGQLSGSDKIFFYNKISKYNCEIGENK